MVRPRGSKPREFCMYLEKRKGRRRRKQDSLFRYMWQPEREWTLGYGILLLFKQTKLHLPLCGFVRDPFFLDTLPSVGKLRILQHITALV